MKTLCELILDEKQPIQKPEATTSALATATEPAYQPVIVQPTFQQPVSLNQPKKLEMEDGSNGDSLFDF